MAEYLRRAGVLGITWPVPDGLDDAALERRLFSPPFVAEPSRPQPDWPRLHAELRRPGVTLLLLWEEYRAGQSEGYGYSRFCDLHVAWRGKLSPTMRQTHPAGERMFVDYAGQTVDVIDGATGEVRAAQVFVAALGASNLTYAEARWTQALPDWIGCHVGAFAFFGGVARQVVCDNLKSGVIATCRYEPGISRTYQEMAGHYGTAVLPGRVRRPRDKAKVEVAVQVVQRWILARLRNQRFFSLAELNAAIRALTMDLNNRTMRHLGTSRRALFEAVEQPALLPLSSRTASTGPTAPTPCPTSCPSSTATSAAAATTIEEDDTMLTHPTTDRLREMGLAGMARALEEQRRQPDNTDLGFEDRLAMSGDPLGSTLVDREALERDTKRLAARLRFAGLRQQATPEDIDHRAGRGLDRALFQRLTGGEWIERHQDLLVTGPTGTGKTWLSCALGHRACRDNRSVLYQRVPRLLEALGLARGDGRYARMLKSLARVQLLILDDWAMTPLTAEQRRDLMEIIDDRHDRASTIVTSQVPVEHWHEHIGNPTIADAVLDRLVHGAHRLNLKGESMRKLRAATARLDEAAAP